MGWHCPSGINNSNKVWAICHNKSRSEITNSSSVPCINFQVVSNLITREGLDIVGFEAINTNVVLVLQKNINDDIKKKLEKLKVIIHS